MRKSLPIALFGILLASVVQAHEWTDATGQYQVVAEFVGRQGSLIFVRTLDGKAAKCELAQLSRSDQKFVESLTATAHGAGLADPAPTPQSAATTSTATTSAVGLIRQASEKSSDLRFVYSGRFGTFHLYGQAAQATQATEYSGTALYLSDGNSHSGTLKPAGADDNFLYFDLAHDDRETRVTFSKSPDADQLYGVHYWSSGKWSLFEAQKRETFAIAPASNVPTLFRTAQYTTRGKAATTTASVATTQSAAYQLTSYGGGGGRCGLNNSCSISYPCWNPCWNTCWYPCWNPCWYPCWNCCCCCCW